MKNRYAFIVLSLFHALVAFAALNVIVWLISKATISDNPVTFTFGAPSLAAVYPGRSLAEVNELLSETWNRRAEFRPFTVTGERPFHGRYVNVSNDRFRVSRDQGPWPPDPERLNVFVFGGSTTFGYGVADDETVVSMLQASLAARFAPRRVACYNFGNGAYYSSQERAFFEELVAADRVPDLAVFIDGLNEFIRVPWPSVQLRGFLDSPVGFSLENLRDELPVVTLIARLKAKGRPARQHPGVPEDLIDRYFANRQLIRDVAGARHVSTLFVLQPVPVYKYDLRNHVFGQLVMANNQYVASGYIRLAERIREDSSVRDVLWAGDMQESIAKPLYVDEVHYSAAMCAMVADEIARTIFSRQLLEKH